MKRLLIAALCALTLTGCAQLRGYLELAQAVLPDVFQSVAVRVDSVTNKLCADVRSANDDAEFQAALDRAGLSRMDWDSVVEFCVGAPMPE